ncbi:hypothetical protein ACQPZJ_17225 [Actinoplanes sp. CA-054009]
MAAAPATWSRICSAGSGAASASPALTRILAAAGRPAVSRALLVRRPLLAALSRAHVGRDGFAVTVDGGGSFSGRDQSRATGVVAARIIDRLPGLAPGVRHIEQVVEPVPFLRDVTTAGFALDLGRWSC